MKKLLSLFFVFVLLTATAVTAFAATGVAPSAPPVDPPETADTTSSGSSKVKVEVEIPSTTTPAATATPSDNGKPALKTELPAEPKPIPPTYSVYFTDVPESHWAYSDIIYAAGAGTVVGDGQGHFFPDKSLTREEFATLLVTTFHASAAGSGFSSFTDVSASRWSSGYIEATKSYLTGYVSPFDGSLTFKPTAIATREDVAVALVRMLGLNVTENTYAQSRFTDYAQISPELRNAVGVALANGLISGYLEPTGNYTFRPQELITRAGTVVLLARAAKTVAADSFGEIDVDITSAQSATSPTQYTLYVTSSRQHSVKVDGKDVETLYDSVNNCYSALYQYTFKQEGTHTFQIEVGSVGRSKSFTHDIAYSQGVIRLTVNQSNTTVSANSFEFTGSVYDLSYPVTLTVNDKPVKTDSTGTDWTYKATLTEGSNTFVFRATDRSGATSIITRTITYSVGAPVLKLDSYSSAVVKPIFTVSGTVESDLSVILKINGSTVSTNSGGKFSREVSLSVGINTIDIAVEDARGRKDSQRIQVNYTPGAPLLDVRGTTSTVTTAKLNLYGYLSVDSIGILNVNGAYIYVDYTTGAWSYEYTLVSGLNVLVFTATNAEGGITTVTRNVTFNPKAPVIAVRNVPTTVTTPMALLSLSLSGELSGLTVYINDAIYNPTSVQGSQYDFTVAGLSSGANAIVVKAINEYGVSAEQTFSIAYNPA